MLHTYMHTSTYKMYISKIILSEDDITEPNFSLRKHNTLPLGTATGLSMESIHRSTGA